MILAAGEHFEVKHITATILVRPGSPTAPPQGDVLTADAQSPFSSMVAIGMGAFLLFCAANFVVVFIAFSCNSGKRDHQRPSAKDIAVTANPQQGDAPEDADKPDASFVPASNLNHGMPCVEQGCSEPQMLCFPV